MISIAFYLLLASASYSVATNDVSTRVKRCTCMQSSCSCAPIVLSIQMTCSCPVVPQPCPCGQISQPCQPVCQEVCQRQCVHSQCVPVCWNTCSTTCGQQPQPQPTVPIITQPPQTIPTTQATLPTIPPTIATQPPIIVTQPPQPPQQCCAPACTPCIQVPTVQCIQIMYMQCYCSSGYAPCGNGSQCCKK